MQPFKINYHNDIRNKFTQKCHSSQNCTNAWLTGIHLLSQLVTAKYISKDVIITSIP